MAAVENLILAPENTMNAIELRLKQALIVSAMPQLLYARLTPRER